MATESSQFVELYGKPAPWTGYANAQEFIKYLNKAKKENRVKDLNEEEKKCLASLEDYQKESGDDEKEEAAASYDEDSIDWTRINDDVGLSFYFVFPSSMLSNANLNIQNFVMSKYETMTKGEIVEYAKKKLKEKEGKNNSKDKDKKPGEKESENTEENTEEKTEENKPETKTQNARTQLFDETKDFMIQNNKDIIHETLNQNENGQEGQPRRKLIDPEKIDPDIIKKAEELLNEDGREM